MQIDEDGPKMSGPILDTLGQGPEGSNVFDLYLMPNGNFVVREACDHCLLKELTPDELRQLGEELIAISKMRPT